MTPLGWPLLADENIGRRVVAALRDTGHNVAHCRDTPGASDHEVLQRAEREGRVVLTHDSDLPALVLRQRLSVIGVVYLRPPQIDPHLTIETLHALERATGEVAPGFVIVADRRSDRLRVRLRRW